MADERVGVRVRVRRREVQNDITPVPRQVMKHYNQLVVSIDVMHVNRNPFLVSICKHIHYGTATVMEDMEAPTMLQIILDLNKFFKTTSVPRHSTLHENLSSRIAHLF